jgi:hypothetical protein
MLIDIDTWYDKSTKVNPSDITTTINPITYMVYALYKYPEAVSVLGDIDIYLFSTSGILRFNPSKIDKDTYRVFIRELNKLLKKIPNSSLDSIESVDDEAELDSDELETVPSTPNTGNTTATIPRGEDVKNTFIDDTIDNSIDELKQMVDQVQGDESDEADMEDSDGEEQEIPTPDETTDEEFGEILSTMVSVRHARKNPRSEASIQRDVVLKQNQSKLVVEDKTIEELTNITEEDKDKNRSDIIHKSGTVFLTHNTVNHVR